MGPQRVADRLGALQRRYDLAPGNVEALGRLLAALEAEPDPPTTVRRAAEAVDVHVADSLSALEVRELLTAARVADAGAGAGFPGLALAACLPAAAVDLVEATRRKCETIERLAVAAGLGNARALPVRAEELAAGADREHYDVVTARALAPLAVILEYAAPLLRFGGCLVAWKGQRDAGEEDAARRTAAILGMGDPSVLAVTPYPGSRNRHLHVYLKVGPTPPGFPRRPGAAAKRPLG